MSGKRGAWEVCVVKGHMHGEGGLCVARGGGVYGGVCVAVDGHCVNADCVFILSHWTRNR